MHTTKFFKKIISYFHTTKNSKIYVSMHFGFNNQFIKVTRSRPIFQNLKKNHFFFNIKDYELIRKIYSRY
jgi:hypothetical protein